MSTETQDHQEWVHLEAARELESEGRLFFEAMYEIGKGAKKVENEYGDNERTATATVAQGTIRRMERAR